MDSGASLGEKIVAVLQFGLKLGYLFINALVSVAVWYLTVLYIFTSTTDPVVLAANPSLVDRLQLSPPKFVLGSVVGLGIAFVLTRFLKMGFRVQQQRLQTRPDFLPRLINELKLAMEEQLENDSTEQSSTETPDRGWDDDSD